MQRVFTETVGNYRRGDCPEQPVWWWDRYKDVSVPLATVVEAGLSALANRAAAKPRRKTA